MKAKRWEGVDVTLHEQNKVNNCSISAVGMFLCVRKRQKGHLIYIFLPDFTPGRVIGDLLTVNLQCVSMVHVSHFVKFSKEDDVDDFIEFVSETIVQMQRVVDDPSAFNNDFSIEVTSVTPDRPKPHHYTFTLSPTFGTVKLERRGYSRTLQVTDIHCGCLTKPVKNFKESSRTEWGLEILDPTTGLYVCVCGGEQEMMQIVLMTYIHAFRIVRAKNREKQTLLDPEPSTEEEYESKSQIVIEVETIDITSPPKVPSNDIIKSPTRKRTTRFEKNSQNVESFPVSERPTFIRPGQEIIGKCQKRYEALENSLTTLHFQEPLSLPGIRELSAPISKSPGYSLSDIHGIIVDACSTFPNEPETANFGSYDRRTTNEIVDDAEKGANELEPVVLSTFVNLGDFDKFPLDEYLQASQPATPFLTVLTEVSQQLLECGGKVIGNDPLGRALAILIIAVLTNGMPDKHRFFDVYSVYSDKIEGFQSIVDEARKVANPWEQISLFTILLLNNDSILPLLKLMRVNDDWIRENFLIAGLVRCDSLFEDVINILQSTLLRVQFRMIPAPDLILGGDPSLVDRFVQTMIMSFLGIAECIKERPFVPDLRGILRFLCRLLSSCAQGKYILQERSTPGKTAFSFIRKLVSSHFLPKNQDWTEMADVTRVISSNTDDFTASLTHMIKSDVGKEDQRLSRWIENGIARRKIHVWFFFLGTNPALASKYFSPESVLLDMYRFKYVITYLATFMRQ